MSGQYSNLHHPVLLPQVVELLSPSDGESYLDLTAGAGSHANAVISAASNIQATLVDRDQKARDILSERFKGSSAQIIDSDMKSAVQGLVETSQSFDMVLADLGLSSMQLDSMDRGFSYERLDAPLDMRMDANAKLTARDILNHYSQIDLVKVFSEGGMPSPKNFVTTIVKGRPYRDVSDLTKAARRSFKGSPQGMNKFMALVFQSLRIEVNSELDQLKALLASADQLLNPGGRIAIISFHSGEDKIVKDAFTEMTKDKHFGQWRLLTKPIFGHEYDNNPRARSAVLRAAAKKQK